MQDLGDRKSHFTDRKIEAQRGLCLAQVHLASKTRSQVCWLHTRLHLFFGITPSSPSRAVLDSNATVFTPGIVIRVTASLSLLRFMKSIFAPSNILLT